MKNITKQILFIRADANSQIGTGHIMRCIALSQAWQEQGGQAIFLSSVKSDGLRKRILDEGFELISINNPHPHPEDKMQVCNLLARANKENPVWIALDGYHFDPTYQLALRATGCKLLIIDDTAHQPVYHADILLNQNINAKNLHYNCASDTVLFLGTRYVLLRKEFLKWKKIKRKIPEVAKRVLVTMGGADPDNVTLKVVKALKLTKIPDMEVKIVVGPLNPNLFSLKMELAHSSFSHQLLTSVDDMPSLMAWADIAISAGGSSCWELAFMGLPFIVIIIAENQEGIAKKLAKHNSAVNCGWFNSFKVSDLAKRIVELMEIKNKRISLSLNAKRIMDNNCVKCVVKEIINKNCVC